MNPRKQYHQLLQRHGHQTWWPITTVNGERCVPPSPMTDRAALEICLGAILTQNTSWTNVEKSLMKLKRARMLSLAALLRVPQPQLARLVRSSGYYRQKAKKVKTFVRWLHEQGGSFVRWSNIQNLSSARRELLCLYGIGPETADAMLLYAGGKPTFVIDTYTKRLCASYGLRYSSYEKYQAYFQSNLPRSVQVYQEFHALIVRWGKEKPRQE